MDLHGFRRRLSVPVKACHWPLPECTKCTAWPVFVRGALKFGIRPAAFQLAGSQHYEIVGQNDGAEAVREWNSPNGESTGGPYPEAACRCTYAKNCALVISEDPLLRPSLLVMSLGISEVHTVVVRLLGCGGSFVHTCTQLPLLEVQGIYVWLCAAPWDIKSIYLPEFSWPFLSRLCSSSLCMCVVLFIADERIQLGKR